MNTGSPTVTRRDVCKSMAAGLGLGVLAPSISSCAGGSGKELTVLAHWSDPDPHAAMKKLLGEYGNRHEVSVDFQTVSFDQLLPRITADRAAGKLPDLMHVYALWLPDFVEGGALATPPPDVVDDVKVHYTEASKHAVTYDSRFWGYPTELDTYQLIYNKRHFEQAGVDRPPATFDELRATARELTRNTGDKTARAGYTLSVGWDSGVVHPFTSLLWSNGGEYISHADTKALFDSTGGLDVLGLQRDMIRDGSIDLSLNYENFPKSRTSMVIMANWWRYTLKTTFEDGFDNVGVAPIPHGPGGAPTPVQYNWLWAVSKTSKNKKAAWDLARWLNKPRGDDKASPTGKFLAQMYGALPSRVKDQEILEQGVLQGPFMAPFLKATKRSRPERPIPNGQQIKTTLEKNIEAAWYGKKSPEQALSEAATKADKLLAKGPGS